MKDSPSRGYVLRHVALGTLLTVSLFLALGWIYAGDSPSPLGTPTAPIVQLPTWTPELEYPDEVIEIGYGTDGRFGLRSTIGDPERNDDNNKLLTYDFAGQTSNTRVYVDGKTPIYGSSEGHFVEKPSKRGEVISSAWVFDRVQASQKIEIVAGSSTHRLDTLRIEYVLENQDSSAHEVGLRIMLDTLIGENDGVPFVVPGRSGITDRAVDLTEIPDFIQALEKADLVNPGVIVHLTLKGGEASPPDRLVISAWYDMDMPWDFIDGAGGVGSPLVRLGSIPDSSVGLYYTPTLMTSGEKRIIVTFYGLGGISSTETHNATLSLTFNRVVAEKDIFWIVAMVVRPTDGQSLRLELPDGLALVAGHTAEQPVVGSGDYTQVSWLVEAKKATSDAVVRVILSPDGLTEEQSITVLTDILH